MGLKTDDPSILSAECLLSRHLVYDTIYQPPCTSLLVMAAQAGCRTANGLSMLLHQGALAFQHWYPASTPLEIMHSALTGY